MKKDIFVFSKSNFEYGCNCGNKDCDCGGDCDCGECGGKGK